VETKTALNNAVMAAMSKNHGARNSQQDLASLNKSTEKALQTINSSVNGPISNSKLIKLEV
jgi:hypothetical protein